MKKNILKVTLVIALVLVAGYNVYTSQRSVTISDLALANVEALAADEGLTLECDGSLMVKCERSCSACYRTWSAIGGHGRPGRFHGTCVCGASY